MELSRHDGSVIAVEIIGDRDAAPVLYCHGLADSRLSAWWFGPAARQLGLCVLAPDRPGAGGTDPRWLGRLADWADDAALVLDALRIERAALLGVSAGGPFAAACAATMPGRFGGLLLVSPLGAPGWPTRGMAPGERVSFALARHAPGLGGWSLGRLAGLAQHRPELFLRLAATSLPDSDIRALEEPSMRVSFITSYLEAFRRGTWGVTQDLRLLTRPWGFDLGSIAMPTTIYHGDADTTVPIQHARLYAAAIPGANLLVQAGYGHFSILDAPRDILAVLAAGPG